MTTTFTPALGHSWLSDVCDPAIALLTRERVWRRALVEALDPRAGERIMHNLAQLLADRLIMANARVNSLTVRSNRMRGARPKAVANRRIVGV